MKTNLVPSGVLSGLIAFATGQASACKAQDFAYTTSNGVITITKYYIGPGGAVTIPDTIDGLPVVGIGDSAFSGWPGLYNVTIPDSVTNIGSLAFASSGLIDVTIPDGVTGIGNETFAGCHNLTSVTIGNSVTSIGYGAFGGCPRLTAIAVDTNNPAYSGVAGVLFDKSGTVLIQWPGGNGGAYTVPDTVTKIADFAFYDGAGLTSVVIPNSVTSIGDSAFSGCNSLMAINVDTGNPDYRSVDGILFNKSQTTLIQYPRQRIGTSYTIPDSVTNIADNAFNGCFRLTNLTIGNRVAGIGEGAFLWCINLASVTIPNSVTSLGSAAFGGCDNLTSVYFLGNPPYADWTVFTSGNATPYYLPGTTGWASTFAGRTTALWVLPYPLILAGDPSFGAPTNGFGFTVSWATNVSVVVEAGTDLANPSWSPLATNDLSLTSGSFYFADPQWTNYPSRFYRVRSLY